MKNTPPSRARLILAAMFATLVALSVWAYGRLATSHQAAQTAAENQLACQRLSAQILRIRGRPTRAAAAARSTTELARRIEEASQAAKLPEESLVRIDPEIARRIGESSYKEQPTHIELRNVTLEQLVTFLVTLSRSESGLETRRLRLSAPRREAAQEGPLETWLAEVTLTYLVFSPKTTVPSRPK